MSEALPPPPEFSRMVKVRPHPPEALTIEASDSERAALAQRFGIAAIDSLVAVARFAEDGANVSVEGTVDAALVQECAVAGDRFPVKVAESFSVRMIPPVRHPTTPDEEIELDEDDLDEIEFDGESFDLGEIVAQTLALAIDPYAEGPNAEAARKEAGIVSDEEPQDGPLADLLRGLKKN
ncbi:DUF177 domain-containing protein [Altererythrobacter sp. FM1]|uniref:DUF177 domain-containing protein n=1 Tax=Tsuneonella flava TaxID=2055955 RepID=A0ABX7KC67_9SPHN|nr:YceD family protein [Tsuneonella flava]QSB44756.1 DUF177 domain-containing protein [Tsuneonella flava]ROT96477.1 DUF177 domain-containing protein [Altererythrobacter sp. FM1]